MEKGSPGQMLFNCSLGRVRCTRELGIGYRNIVSDKRISAALAGIVALENRRPGGAVVG